MFLLPPEAVRDLGARDQAILDQADAAIRADRELRWKVVQRGFWVHGVADLRSYLASTKHFTMEGRAGRIACATLITQAENDALAAGAGGFLDALRCPRTLLRFTSEEGADGHCAMQNRSLVNRRVPDRLDEPFQIAARFRLRRACAAMPSAGHGGVVEPSPAQIAFRWTHRDA